MMQSYRALGFHPSLADGRAGGVIVVEAEGLRFLGEDGVETAWLPFDGLQMKLMGMNGDVPEFRHPAAADWVVVGHDRDLLNEPHLLAQRELHGGLRKAARTKGWSGMVVGCMVLLGLVLLMVLPLWIYRQEIVEYIVKQIPVSTETEFGETIWEQVKAQEKIINDAALEKQLAEVTSLLVPHVKAPEGMKFTFHIAKNDELINAFAMPGGHVVVYTALLKKVKRKEQLAGVLAHELAHVTERHGLERMVGSVGLSTMVGLLIGDATVLQAVLAGGSELLLGQKFSRDAETEADDVAWDTLIKAKLDPRGLAEFFLILQEEEKKVMGNLMNGPLKWISTHPATDERIARLRAKERSLK